MSIPLVTPFNTGLIASPRLEVYANGNRLWDVLEVTITNGLAQDVATAEIVHPSPVPAGIGKWAHIVVIAGLELITDPEDSSAPPQIFTERFIGYNRRPGASMWPNTETLHCEDILTIAAEHYTPEEVSFANKTDDEAVRFILTEPLPVGCGYSPDILDFGAGTGKLLGDVDTAQLIWATGQTALEKIKEIDEVSLGWRTQGKLDGRIGRAYIDLDPNTQTEVFWFYEGRHIIDGSIFAEQIDPKNEIEVAGFGDISAEALLDPNQDPFDWRQNSYWIRFRILQQQAIDAGILSTQEQAVYILSRISRPLLKLTFSTHLGIIFRGHEVIGVTSTTFRCHQRFWVQTAQLTIGADGSFTQTLTCVSELLRDLNWDWQVPPIVGVVPGSRVTLPALPPPTPPSAADLFVNFAITTIDQEYGEQATEPLTEHGMTKYAVMASDLTFSRTGNIVSRTWTADGPGVLVTTGDGPTFTTGFSDLAGATITEDVEDSNGSTGSKTLPVFTYGTPIRLRKLYSATASILTAWNGSVWRDYTPGGTVRVVAMGPWWGWDDKVAYSADDLLTAPTSVVALPASQNVTAIWKFERNQTHVAVGGSSGGVAVSHDKGATWIQRTNPDGTNQVNFIIVSIHDYREIHVMTSTGWHKSQNEGQSWAPVRAGNFTYLELAPARNIIITSAGELQNADTGQAFTFQGGGSHVIVAATAHIRSDRFYAFEDNGSTWYVETPGSYELVPGAPIPNSGLPHHAGSYRDGTIVDLVYIAASTGLYKTLDGCRTAGGYVRLRQEGILTP